MQGFKLLGVRSTIALAVGICRESCRGVCGRFRIERHSRKGEGVSFSVWRQYDASPIDPTFLLSDTDLNEIEQRTLLRECVAQLGAFVVQKEIASANVEGIGE